MIIFKPGDYVYVLKNGANNSVHPRRNQNSVAEVGRVIFIQDIEYEADERMIHCARAREASQRFCMVHGHTVRGKPRELVGSVEVSCITERIPLCQSSWNRPSDRCTGFRSQNRCNSDVDRLRIEEGTAVWIHCSPGGDISL